MVFADILSFRIALAEGPCPFFSFLLPIHTSHSAMSEVQTRSQAPASRGRGGGRGGRGGFGGRSEGRPGNTRRPNGDKTTSDAFDEDGDLGELRKQFGDKVDMIKAIFPDWSDADILYALQETDGDVEVAATRISEGRQLLPLRSSFASIPTTSLPL